MPRGTRVHTSGVVHDDTVDLDDDPHSRQRTQQQSQRLPHCRSECCEVDDLVKKVGVDGCYEDEVVMGCAGCVGSQIRQHGACDGDESQDVSGDSSRHPRE